MDELMTEHPFYAIINFAAESHVDRSINSPLNFIHTNVIGTSVLLDCARRHGVQRFIQISTDEVYGSLGATGKFTEQSPLDPSSPTPRAKPEPIFLRSLLIRLTARKGSLPAARTTTGN